MSFLASVYLGVAELALWLMGSSAVTALLPWKSCAPITYLAAIWWRYGWLGVRSLIGSRFKLSWAFIILLMSAVVSWETTIPALTSSPSSIFAAPLSEELLYRYVIPKVLDRRLPKSLKHRERLASLISAVLFTFAHRNLESDHYIADMLVCFFSGLALGFRSARRKSITETFVIHSLHNLHVIAGRIGAAGTTTATISYGFPLVFYGIMIANDVYRDYVEVVHAYGKISNICHTPNQIFCQHTD